MHRDNMTRRRFIEAGAAAALLPLAAPALAQAWPSKPIKIICGYPAGGQTDAQARAYGDYFSKQTGQPVLVENKSGAGGNIAAQELKRAPADGYTLMMTISTTMVMNRVLYKNPGFDADKDFEIVSIMPTGGIPLYASAKSGATNLKDFIDYARKTEKVSVGTYAAGSYAHIVVAELNKQYGLKIEPVHYRGEAPMWTDLMSQSLDGAIGSYAFGKNVQDAGRGRAVAIHLKRSPKLPDVPTFQEQGATSRAFGLSGYQILVAPAGIPADILQRLSDLCVVGGKSEKVQDMLITAGIEDSALSREKSLALYKEETPIWLTLVKDLGLTPE